MLQKLQEQLQLGKTLTLKVKIVPQSKQNQIVGTYAVRAPALSRPSNKPSRSDTNVLKIKIAATPEKGKANKELIRFLSETFNTPQKNIEIISGTTSPLKIIKIQSCVRTPS